MYRHGGAYIADVVWFALQADEVSDIDDGHLNKLTATSTVARIEKTE